MGLRGDFECGTRETLGLETLGDELNIVCIMEEEDGESQGPRVECHYLDMMLPLPSSPVILYLDSCVEGLVSRRWDHGKCLDGFLLEGKA